MYKSLKFKVVASFILFVVIPIIVGAVIIVIQIKNTQINQLELINNQMTKRVASEFENYVSYNLSQIKQLTELNELPFSNPAKIHKKLLSEIMFNNNFDQIILLDKNGKEMVHVHRYKIISPNETKDYSGNIEFLFPKLNRSTFYGNVMFIEEIGEPIINISYDIRNPRDDSLMGVMIISLRLKPIWNLLANISVQPGQQIYILDAKNRLVAHPNPSMVLKNIIYKIPSGHIAKGLNGKMAFITYSKINFGNQFFTIVSQHNLKDAFKLLSYISLVIILVVCSTLIMCLVLIIVNIKFVVNPIKHLSKVAKEIEAGNLDKKAEVFVDDEIGEMAKAFNSMTGKLKDNANQLQKFNLGLQEKIKGEIEKTRKMEQLLFEQKKFADMGQMINAIAHQWRQPLNNIGLIQQFLYDGFMNGDITNKEFKEYSDSLMDIVQNMSATIDDFRTFFTTKKAKERFNVIHAIRDFLKLTTAQLTSSNIKYFIRCSSCGNKHLFDEGSLNFECENSYLNVIGHSGEFKQVLQNIVANAKDAFIEQHTDEPRLEIYVYQKDKNVEIIFRDNGGGIMPDALPNIFDPYFTTKEEGKGTGIGLYISKVIIDEHFGGKLSAKNVGAGAEFTITIPCADKSGPAQ